MLPQSSTVHPNFRSVHVRFLHDKPGLTQWGVRQEEPELRFSNSGGFQVCPAPILVPSVFSCPVRDFVV